MALISELNTYASNLPSTAWMEFELASGAPGKISPTAFFGGMGNLSSLGGSSIASGDRIPIVDVSAASGVQAKYFNPTDIFHTIPLLTYVTVPDAAAQVAFYGDGGSPRRVGVIDFFRAMNNAASFSDPTTSDFFIALDGVEPKLLTMGNFLNIITTLSTFATLVDGGSGALFYRHSDGFTYKITPDVFATGKQTIWMPCGAMASATTNGPAAAQRESSTNKINYGVLTFANDATVRWAHFNVAFPKSTNVGATVTFIPYWTAPAGSGNLVVQLQAVAVSNDDVLDASFSSSVTSVDTLTATGDVMVGPESSGLTINGTWTEGDIVFFRVGRDASHASDTFNNTAELIGIKVIFTMNKRDDA